MRILRIAIALVVAIPVLRTDPSKGILAQTDARNGKLVKLHELPLQIFSPLAVKTKKILWMLDDQWLTACACVTSPCT